MEHFLNIVPNVCITKKQFLKCFKKGNFNIQKHLMGSFIIKHTLAGYKWMNDAFI